MMSSIEPPCCSKPPPGHTAHVGTVDKMVTQTRSLLMSSRLVKIFLVVSLVAVTRSVAADDSIDAFLEEVKELVSRESEFSFFQPHQFRRQCS